MPRNHYRTRKAYVLYANQIAGLMDKIFKLKDGRTCTIRECVEADAEAALKLFRIAAAESDNLARLPDEIKLTPEKEREYIRTHRDSPNSIFVIAEVDGSAVALAGVEGQKLRKFAHHGELGMCVLREFWRFGIGRAILDYLEAWARQAGLRKLCLRVYDFNEPAYRLYSGAGFAEEGRLKADVLRADGTYGDTLYMAKHFV